MEKTELKLEYEVLENNKNGIPVIIVAAGASSRMKGINKQLLMLGGMPVLIRTLLAFENSDCISNIILVVRDEDLFRIQMLTHQYNVTKLSDIVCGGATRQESVLKGISRLKENDKNVLIHDGARPFVNNSIIKNVSNALKKYYSVTCGVNLKDTIKEVDENGKVIKTLNRSSLFSVQTPQGVNVEKYLKACENIDVASFTDDTSIMESSGYETYVVEGSYKNIKITTKEDIASAEGFLGEEDL